MYQRSAACLPLITVVPIFFGGCVAPGPRYFPMSAIETARAPDGAEMRLFDTDGSGRADYAEHLGANGVLARIAYDENEDGTFDPPIALSEIPASEIRDLVLLLDSVPFGVVHELWNAGRLRMFAPPSRTISPFPVMTDVSFAEFFGVSPCPGIESAYYDGAELEDGYANYLHGRNTPWHRGADYRLRQLVHAVAYLDPLPWLDHELGQIERAAQEHWEKGALRGGDGAADSASSDPERAFVGYCVATSSVGAWLGRNGHQAALTRVDRMCQGLIHRSRGRVRISMLSDHGHNLMRSRRLPLPETLTAMGWRVSSSLKRPDDVVLPQFGIVTCAAVHTRRAEAVARDCVGIEGVEHIMWRDTQDRIAVMSRAGLAHVRCVGTKYSYVPATGDPLELSDALRRLDRDGRRDMNGFADDGDWFAATRDHKYPDPLQRVWRAFHGLVEHPADVLIAIQDGWHSGSPFQTRVIGEMRAAHGNLGYAGSCGFAASMAGALPATMRMNELRAALRSKGVWLVVH